MDAAGTRAFMFSTVTINVNSDRSRGKIRSAQSLSASTARNADGIPAFGSSLPRTNSRPTAQRRPRASAISETAARRGRRQTPVQHRELCHLFSEATPSSLRGEFANGLAHRGRLSGNTVRERAARNAPHAGVSDDFAGAGGASRSAPSRADGVRVRSPGRA